MPWNILPALVVLWGVCWMFYNSPGYEDPSSRPVVGGEVDLLSLDWSIPAYEESFWNQVAEPLPSDTSMIEQQPQSYSNNIATEFAFRTLFADYIIATDPFDPIECTSIPAIPVVQAQSGSKDVTSNYTPLPDPSALSGDTSFTTQPSEAIHRPTGDLNLELTAPSQAPISPTHLPLAPQPSTEPSQDQSNSRHTQSHLTCPHPECASLTFAHAFDWKKHNTRLHNRYKCDLPPCCQSFGTKGELHRHKQTKHAQLPPHKHLRCPVSDCKHALTPNFKRKDNLTDHLRRVHGLAHGEAKRRADAQARRQVGEAVRGEDLAGRRLSFGTGKVQSEKIAGSVGVVGPSTPVNERIQSPDIDVGDSNDIAFNPSKRRRITTSLPALDNSHSSSAPSPNLHAPLPNRDHDDDTHISAWKARALEAEKEASLSRAENMQLQLENSELKGEVERLKRHRDSLREMLEEERET